MKRRLLNLLSAGSLLLCAAALALWVRSYRAWDSFIWVRRYSVTELPQWAQANPPDDPEFLRSLRLRAVGYAGAAGNGDVSAGVLATDWQSGARPLSGQSAAHALIRHHQRASLAGHLGNELGDRSINKAFGESGIALVSRSPHVRAGAELS